MAEATQQQQSGPRPEPDPMEGANDAAKAAAEAAANGKPEKAPEGSEAELLAFLNGGGPPIVYTSRVKIALPSGVDGEVDWSVLQMDGKEIDRIERAHMPQGPMGPSDNLAEAAEIVSRATKVITLPQSGHEIDIRSGEFLGGLADPMDAIVRTFRFQQGILANLAGEIRRISGWSSDRVGEAQAKHVKAVEGFFSERA